MNKQATLKQFIEVELLSGSSTVGYDDDLLLSGLVNSLGVMRLVSFTQEQFHVEIPVEDVIIENFRTIDAICSYLEARAS
jgi:acyl carrier protein